MDPSLRFSKSCDVRTRLGVKELWFLQPTNKFYYKKGGNMNRKPNTKIHGKSINKERNSTLSWAKFYLDHGFSVIPLRPKKKNPSIDWTEYQKRRPTIEEIEEWFSEGDYNIGVITGEISGIVVVDLDSEEAIKFAEDNKFPNSPKVKTGKGYHLYFKHPMDKEVRNFQKRDDLPGIDVRGDGGYVVAPPSIHENGKVYEWVDGMDLEDIPLPEFPEIFLVKKQSEKTPLQELYSGVSEGKRNDSLFRIACNHQKDGLSLEECLSYLLSWNERNRPPLPSDEVERTVRGVYERYPDSVSQFNNSIYDNKTKKLNLSTFDPSMVLKKGKEIQQLDIKVEWIIEKLLPKQSISLFHGKGGIGKTWLSLQLAAIVSKGKLFMGLSTIKEPVYYIDFENSLPVLVDRIKKLGIEEPLFWHNSFDTNPPKIDSPEWEAYKKLAPGLLIVDTLRAFQLQDENDSRHMAIIMGRLKELREFGHTILLLHHTPKSNERTYKGSTAIFDLSDHVLSLYRTSKKDADDEDESGQYYRFGTKEKTRYEPFHMFLTFEPREGFVEAQDPDTEDMKELGKIMNIFKKENDRSPNQSEVVKMAKKDLDLSYSKVQKLLKKGEETYWTVETGNIRNRKIYHPVSQFSNTIYSHKTNKLNATDRSDGQQELNDQMPQETVSEPNLILVRRRKAA